MLDEWITREDVVSAIMAGDLRARQRRGGRGTRYVIRGPGVNERTIEVVCRLLPGKVRIITVYRIK
jgi:hypothetical protein